MKHRFLRGMLGIALCLVLTLSVVPLPSRAVDDSWIANTAKELRAQMVARQEKVTFTYASESWAFSPEAFGDTPEAQAVLQQEVNRLLEQVYQQAVAHTGVGNEGDYLKWHIGGRGGGISYEFTQDGTQAKNFVYTITFVFSYYTTKAQEDAVTAKVQAVRSQLNLAGKSDYEKVRAIYDYLCDNVVYDNANLNNQSYTLKYSAYAALLNGTSVCQGYSSLFYRLALEEGIDCRFIFGTSQGTNHSWNIVKLGSSYYNLDATWDAVTKDHRYFLKTDAHMEDHTRGAEYTQPAFLAAYPMATSDYTIPGSTETPPVTPPVTPPPAEDPQPTTIPADQPETEPATEPETQPETEPATQPATVPDTDEAETEPAVSQPVPGTSESNGTTQQNTGSTEASGKAQEEESDKTLLLVLGGAALLGAAAAAAALLSKKRR